MATLEDELTQLRNKFGPDNVKAIGEQPALDSGNFKDAPDVGDTAPDFELPDENGNYYRLSELLKDGPVILSFYRGSWCMFCNIELKALQRSLNDFKKYNATLLGVSPQSIDFSKRNKLDEIKYTVLSDQGGKIADRYNLLFKMPAEMITAMGEFGLQLQDANQIKEGEDTALPVTATFVIGRDQKIVYRFVEADHTKRAEPAEIVAALMSIQS